MKTQFTLPPLFRPYGITREALYERLRPNTRPRFETISKVCAAQGVRLVAQPIHTPS